jgi:hypothetical protein
MGGMYLIILLFINVFTFAVPSFDSWAAEAQLPNTQSLKGIGDPEEGPIFGIDAAYYLEELRYPAKEPLVPALGGFPMTLEATITKAVKDIESCGCKLYFYFDGLDSKFTEPSFSATSNASSTNARAFEVYEMGNAEGAIEHFKHSGLAFSTLLIKATKSG